MKSYAELIKDKRLELHKGADGAAGYIAMPKWKGTVIASWGGGWEHVSVAPFKGKMPSWADMCEIKDMFWNDDEVVVQYHPAKKDYVNQLENCLHLWKPINAEMPTPPSIMVGLKGR